MRTIYNILIHALSNQFVSGGFLLMASGSLIALCRKAPSRAWSWLQRRFIVKLDISNDDPAFFWIASWLAQQPYSRRARSLTVSSKRDHYGNVDGPQVSLDIYLPEIIFTPAPGQHVFFYNRRLVWLSRDRKDAAPDSKGNASFSLWNREQFELRILGRGQAAGRSLIEDARRLAITERKTKTDIYLCAFDYWKRIDSLDPRPLSTVVLPKGDAEFLMADVKAFLNGRQWYKERGVPYRRGYLFHGLSGSGKTSAILALAGELRLNLYILNLSGGSLSDVRLQHLLSEVPPNSIVLLEDIDAAFSARKKSDEINNGVTFSGLLNALDGAASREGWLVFMTTNHANLLDPALVRPGRADVHLEFKTATVEQAERMYCAFFPDAKGVDGFGLSVAAYGMSMAEVQSHLITNKDSAMKALNIPKRVAA